MAHRYTRNQKSNIIYECHTHSVIIDTREIFLFDDGGEINECVSGKLIKNICLLNNINNEPIIIHLMTYGGYWGYGIGVFDVIKNNNNNICIIIHGCAYSMGSVIAQAAKLRIMMPNSEFHLHYGSICYDGTIPSFLSEATQYEKNINKMIDIYAERCIKGRFWKRNKINSKEKIKQYIKEILNSKQEMYLDANQCVEMGFIDGIFGQKPYFDIDSIKKILA